MATYIHVILFSLLGGAISLTGGIALLKTKKRADVLAKYATPFAAGALLAAVFFDLLPEAVEVGNTRNIMLTCLVGILLFFIAERFLHWFHHHGAREKEVSDPSVPLIIVGDTLHNAIDGIAIAAAFLVSVPAGIVTTFAVAAHEIPQEIGDFGLLLNKGLSRKKVLIINIVSALAATLAAVVTFWAGREEAIPVGVLLALSAGFLLYIALSDVIPTIHQHSRKTLFDPRPLLLLCGVIVVGIAITVAHGIMPVHEHEEENDSHETGLVIYCDGEEVALDPYSGDTANFLITPDCEHLETCDEEHATIEGYPGNTPCFEHAHKDTTHDNGTDHDHDHVHEDEAH